MGLLVTVLSPSPLPLPPCWHRVESVKLPLVASSPAVISIHRQPGPGHLSPSLS
jgi:hypothetical protein